SLDRIRLENRRIPLVQRLAPRGDRQTQSSRPRIRHDRPAPAISNPNCKRTYSRPAAIRLSGCRTGSIEDVWLLPIQDSQRLQRCCRIGIRREGVDVTRARRPPPEAGNASRSAVPDYAWPPVIAAIRPSDPAV